MEYKNKVSQVASVGEKMRDFETEFIKVLNVNIHRNGETESEFPDVELHIEVTDKKENYGSTYTYPISEEVKSHNDDMYLFDTVTNWDVETVTLRMGLKE